MIKILNIIILDGLHNDSESSRIIVAMKNPPNLSAVSAAVMLHSQKYSSLLHSPKNVVEGNQQHPRKERNVSSRWRKQDKRLLPLVNAKIAVNQRASGRVRTRAIRPICS